MPQTTRKIANISIATGAGAQTISTLLDAFDLSKAKALTLMLRINTAATVVGTTLDVKLQTTFDDPTLATAVWDTRIYPLTIHGNDTTTGGYTQVLNLSQDVDLTTAERGYTATGSGPGTPGQAELAPGTVRDGLFPPRFRNAQGVQSNWRLQQIVADAAGTGNFVGSVLILTHEWEQN